MMSCCLRTNWDWEDWGFQNRILSQRFQWLQIQVQDFTPPIELWMDGWALFEHVWQPEAWRRNSDVAQPRAMAFVSHVSPGGNYDQLWSAMSHLWHLCFPFAWTFSSTKFYGFLRGKGWKMPWNCYIFRTSTGPAGKAGSSGILRPGLVHLEPLHGEFVSWSQKGSLDGKSMDIFWERFCWGSFDSCSCSSDFCFFLFLFLFKYVQALFVPTCIYLHGVYICVYCWGIITRCHESWDIMRSWYCACLVHPYIPAIAAAWAVTERHLRSSSERQASSTVLRCLDTSGCDGHFRDSCLQKARVDVDVEDPEGRDGDAWYADDDYGYLRGSEDVDVWGCYKLYVIAKLQIDSRMLRFEQLLHGQALPRKDYVAWCAVPSQSAEAPWDR